MNREQLLHQRAVRLLDEGRSRREIAAELGISLRTAYRWLNPEDARRGRVISRRWKDEHREDNRARDRQHFQDTKQPCPHCGEPRSREHSQCDGCRMATARVRQSLTEGMWADNWPLKDMAEALGVTVGYFGCRRLRDGWDLPYRYAVENGKRVAA